VLELFGLIVALKGIRDTHLFFGHPTYMTLLVQWFREFPVSRTQIIAGVGISTGGAFARGRSSVWKNLLDAPSLEERIKVLETNSQHLRTSLENLEKETFQEIDSIRASLKQERVDRTEEDRKILTKLEATETLGLHVAATGAVLLIVGLTMTTVPDFFVWAFK